MLGIVSSEGCAEFRDATCRRNPSQAFSVEPNPSVCTRACLLRAKSEPTAQEPLGKGRDPTRKAAQRLERGSLRKGQAGMGRAVPKGSSRERGSLALPVSPAAGPSAAHASGIYGRNPSL